MRTLWVAVLAVTLGLAGSGTAAQDTGNELHVFATDVYYFVPADSYSIVVGKDCIFMTNQWRPSVVVIENERHEVIAAWPVVGTITDDPPGKRRCETPKGTAIPLPDAAFYLAYLDGEFIGAYSSDALPDWTESLPLSINNDLGLD